MQISEVFVAQTMFPLFKWQYTTSCLLSLGLFLFLFLFFLIFFFSSLSLEYYQEKKNNQQRQIERDGLNGERACVATRLCLSHAVWECACYIVEWKMRIIIPFACPGKFAPEEYSWNWKQVISLELP